MQWKPWKKHKIYISKYIFMHRITYSVSHHGIIKSNIWPYNLMCYCEEEKQFNHLQKYRVFFFFFKSLQLQIASATHQTIQWQTIIKLFWKLLCRKMWPVQCTFVHKKRFYGPARTKVRRPSQVTRQRQGWNVFKLLFAPTFDPRTQDGFS